MIEELISVHNRHNQIKQNGQDPSFRAFEHLKSLLTVFGLLYFIFIFENSLQQQTVAGRIVNNEQNTVINHKTKW